MAPKYVAARLPTRFGTTNFRALSGNNRQQGTLTVALEAARGIARPRAPSPSALGSRFLAAGKSGGVRASCGLGVETGEVALPHDRQSTPQIFAAPPALDTNAHALFLDLDGTLVEFAAHPEQVVASNELRVLLTDLSRAMMGAVALITGRSIASADAVLDGVLIDVAGVHGFERRAGDELITASADLSPIAAALADVRKMAGNGAFQGDIEDKGAALALHYRRAPHLGEGIRRTAADLARRHGLSVLEGSMVVELTLGQRTKGDAVADFMAAAPFAGRVPIAVGDDITDEDAFSSVAKLGGFGILVGPPRISVAQARLEEISAVITWLRLGVRA
jgi:trehalose 6-phosphate phosphatase